MGHLQLNSKITHFKKNNHICASSSGSEYENRFQKAFTVGAHTDLMSALQDI